MIFINNFRRKMSDALEYRRQVNFPDLKWLVCSVTIFTFVYIILSVSLVPEGKPANFNFRETGSVTGLSAIYLALGCGFAISANLIHFKAKGSHQWLWIIIALGLGFLALDELLQFHERGDRLVLEQIISKSTFQNWNDMMVVAYGAIGLPVMLFLLTRLLQYRMVLGLFITAFVFYFIHTTIDTFQTEQTLTSDILEESAKLFSVAFLALGSLTGLVGNIWQYIESSSVTDADLTTANSSETKAVINPLSAH